MKTYTIDITQNTYNRLREMANARDRTPTEMLAIAVNLLHVALPSIKEINKRLFVPAPRRSAPNTKP